MTAGNSIRYQQINSRNATSPEIPGMFLLSLNTTPPFVVRYFSVLKRRNSGERAALVRTCFGTAAPGDTGEGKSYQRATINLDATGVYGVILYTDNYISQTSAISYTSSDWKSMETAGCVFLPAAGARYGKDVSNVGNSGYYWSSSSSAYVNTQAYDVLFYDSEVSISDAIDRNCGLCVRLVTDVSAE